jgi:hypothetical protein
MISACSVRADAGSPCGAPRGQQTGGDCRDQGGGGRERKDPPAQRQLVETRHRRPADAPQEDDAPVGKQQPAGSRECRQDERFQQQQADEAAPGRAQREPHGQLPLTARGTRQQQPGRRRARHHQDEQHRAGDNAQRAAEFRTDHHVEEREHRDTPPAVLARTLDRKLRRHRAEIARDRGRGVAARRPGHDAKRVLEPLLGRQPSVEGHPDIGRGNRHREARRHDADDGQHAIGDRQGASDGIRAAKPPLPQVVADHRDRPCVIVADPASHGGHGSQGGEQARRDRHDRDRFAAVGQLLDARSFVGADLRQRRRARPPVLEIGGRHRQEWNTTLVVARPHPDELAGIRIGERAEQHRIDHAEDRGHPADSEREHHRRGHRIRRRRPQRADPQAGFPPGRVDPCRPHVANRVPRLDDAAEIERGETARLVAGHATRLVPLRLVLEMERQLLVHFGIDGSATEDSASEGGDSGEHETLLVPWRPVTGRPHPDWSTRLIDSANCSQLAVSVCSRRRPAGVSV